MTGESYEKRDKEGEKRKKNKSNNLLYTNNTTIPKETYYFPKEKQRESQEYQFLEQVFSLFLLVFSSLFELYEKREKEGRLIEEEVNEGRNGKRYVFLSIKQEEKDP